MNETTLDPLTILLLQQYQPDKLESIEKQQYKSKIKKAIKASDATVNALIEGYSLEEMKSLADTLTMGGPLSKAAIGNVLEHHFLDKISKKDEDLVSRVRGMSVDELLAFLTRGN